MRRVTISPEVVSQVHFRDKVAPEEKSVLFYNYSEELRFTEDKEEEQRKAEAEGLSWEEWVQRQTYDDVIRDEFVDNRDPADYLYDYFDEGSVKEDDATNNYLMSSIEYGSNEFMEQKSGYIEDENQDHVSYEEDFIENDDVTNTVHNEYSNEIPENQIISSDDVGNIQEDSMYKDNFESSNNGSDPEVSQNQSDPASIEKYGEEDFEGTEESIKITAVENPPTDDSVADAPYSSSNNSSLIIPDPDENGARNNNNNLETGSAVEENENHNSNNEEDLEYSADFSKNEYEEVEKTDAIPTTSTEQPLHSNQVHSTSMEKDIVSNSDDNKVEHSNVPPDITEDNVKYCDIDHDDDNYMTAPAQDDLDTAEKDNKDQEHIEALNGDKEPTVTHEVEVNLPVATTSGDFNEPPTPDMNMTDKFADEPEECGGEVVASEAPEVVAPIETSFNDLPGYLSAQVRSDDALGCDDVPVVTGGDDIVGFEFAYPDHNTDEDTVKAASLTAASLLLEDDNCSNIGDEPIVAGESVIFDLGYDLVHEAEGVDFPSSNSLLDESFDQIIVDQFRDDLSTDRGDNSNIIEQEAVGSPPVNVQDDGVMNVAVSAVCESSVAVDVTQGESVASINSTAEQSSPLSPVIKGSIGREESGGELYQEDFAVSIGDGEMNEAIALIRQTSDGTDRTDDPNNSDISVPAAVAISPPNIVNAQSNATTTLSIADNIIGLAKPLPVADSEKASHSLQIITQPPMTGNVLSSFTAEFCSEFIKSAIHNTVQRKIPEPKNITETSQMNSGKNLSPERVKKGSKNKSNSKLFPEKRFVDVKPLLKEKKAPDPLIEAAAQRKKLQALQRVSKRRFINRTQHMLASLCCNVCNDISTEYTSLLNQLINREEITLSNEACEELYEFYDIYLEDMDTPINSIGQERRIDYDHHISKVVNNKNTPKLDMDHKEILLDMINDMSERYRTHLSTNMRDIDKYSQTFSATIEKLSSIYKSQRLFSLNSFNDEQLRIEVARIYSDSTLSASSDVTEAARHAQEGLMGAKYRMKESFQELLKSDALLRRHLQKKIQMLSNIDKKIKRNELIQSCDVDDLSFEDIDTGSPHDRPGKIEIKIDTSYPRIGGVDSPVRRLSRGFSSQSMGISLPGKKGAKSPGEKSASKGVLSAGRIQRWMQLSTNPTFSMAKFLLNGGTAVAVEEDISAKRIVSSSTPSFAARPKAAAASSVTLKEKKKRSNISIVKHLSRPFSSFSTYKSRSKVYNAPTDDLDDDREEIQLESNPMKLGMKNIVSDNNSLTMVSSLSQLPVLSGRDDTLLQSILYTHGLDAMRELSSVLNESQVSKRIDFLLLEAMEHERMYGNNVDYSFLVKQSRHLRSLTTCISEYTKQKFIKNFNAIILGEVARREARLEYILFLFQLTLNHKDIAAPFTAGLKTSKSVYSLTKSKSDLHELDGGKKLSKKVSSVALDRKIERAISDLVALIQDLAHSRFQLQRECMICLLGVPYFVSTYHTAVEMQLSRDSTDFSNAFKANTIGTGDEGGQGLLHPLYGTTASWDSLYAAKSRIIATLCQSRKQRLDDVANTNNVKSRELRRLITQTDT